MQVLTLWDIMNLFDLPRLAMLLYKRQTLEKQFEDGVIAGRGNQQPSEADLKFVIGLAHELQQYGKDVPGFEDTESAATIFLLHLDKNVSPYDASAFAIELRHLGDALMRDVFRHRFVQVEKSVASFVRQSEPFGPLVAQRFPSSTNDLVEAGNCLGVGCNTAAAFHLMRGAEVGLWELGRDRQIQLAASGAIEFTEWGKIIGELEGAVKAIQQWPNSEQKEQAHKFYNSAVVEIRAFNDGWRRHSAHARPHMPKMEIDEAVALWGHVFRFMNTLAGKIGEGLYTPLVWT